MDIEHQLSFAFECQDSICPVLIFRIETYTYTPSEATEITLIPSFRW